MKNQLKENWWVFLLQGIALAGLGLLLLFWPGLTVITMFVILAVFLVIDGIIRSIMGIVRIGKKGWFWSIIGGLVEIGLGVVVLASPGIAATTMFYILGFALLFRGFVEIVGSGDVEDEDLPRGLSIFAGILDILIGLYLLSSPVVGAVIIFWIVGLYALVAGVVVAVKSFSLRTHNPS